jgi:hypothetical protein
MSASFYGQIGGSAACIFLHEYVLTRRDLSLETIGLMLSLANVCAGGRYLVLDETGLLIAAILERGISILYLKLIRRRISFPSP